MDLKSNKLLNIGDVDYSNYTTNLYIMRKANNTKKIFTDYYLNGFRWYRKCRKVNWYKHQFTKDALELSPNFTGTWWALYGKVNRYSKVTKEEKW